MEWKLRKLAKYVQMLKPEWDDKLRESGITQIPDDPDEYIKLMYAHPEYVEFKEGLKGAINLQMKHPI